MFGERFMSDLCQMLMQNRVYSHGLTRETGTTNGVGCRFTQVVGLSWGPDSDRVSLRLEYSGRQFRYGLREAELVSLAERAGYPSLHELVGKGVVVHKYETGEILGISLKRQK